MKNFFWNFFQKIFKTEITNLKDNYAKLEKLAYYEKMTKEQEMKRTLSNYPIGTKIISQSNEPSDLLIATIVSHEILPYGIILIAENFEGTRFTLLDKNPAYWAPEREEALSKLDWAERYNVMSKYHYFINNETKQYKESPEYKNRLMA